MTTVLPDRARHADTQSSVAAEDWAGVAERLMSEFEGRVGLAEVSRAVRSCWRELAASGAEPAAGELERCTREQLDARCR